MSMEHHDPSLVDAESGLMDTLPVFRRTLARADGRNDPRQRGRQSAQRDAREGSEEVCPQRRDGVAGAARRRSPP